MAYSCRLTLLASLLLAVAVQIPAGQAQLKLCNSTPSKIGIAIGYMDKDGWTSEGWWNADGQSCATLIQGALQARFYRIYVFDYDKGGEWSGPIQMCTADKEFTIHGMENCQGRGFKTSGFFEVDTQSKPDWTVNITDDGPSTPAPVRTAENAIKLLQGAGLKCSTANRIVECLGSERDGLTISFYLYEDGSAFDRRVKEVKASLKLKTNDASIEGGTLSGELQTPAGDSLKLRSKWIGVLRNLSPQSYKISEIYGITEISDKAVMQYKRLHIESKTYLGSLSMDKSGAVKIGGDRVREFDNFEAALGIAILSLNEIIYPLTTYGN
jgi:uncharacterized membrane protein